MSDPIEDWELSAFIDGDLPSRDMAEIEAALEALPEHRHKLLQMMADHWELAALGQAELDAFEAALPPHLAALAAELGSRLGGGVGEQAWSSVVVLAPHPGDRRPRSVSRSPGA